MPKKDKIKDSNLKLVEPKKIFSDEEKDEFIAGIYEGTIAVETLDENIYKQVADYLMKGVKDGYKNDMIKVSYGEPDYEMLQSLQENVFRFSAAKEYSEVKEMSEMLIDENGDKRTFAEFKETVDGVFTDYNENFLASEYNFAMASSRNASQWVTFEKNKDIYPQIQVIVSDDETTCEECSEYIDFVADKDDPILDTLSPPFHPNCRCSLIEVEGQENSDQEDIVVEDDAWSNNSGKTGEIFSSEHPYFVVDKKDYDLALHNFNLPLPKEK